MGWNTDDGTRYRADDGRVFNTEKDAENHYKQQAENAAAAEAHAKYLAWVKEVLDQAWDLINKGDNKGAVDFLNNHKCQSSQLAYPLGMAYENLGDNQSAAHFYSDFLQKYIASNNVNEENSNNNVLYSRARVYIKLGDWKKAKTDCNSVMYAEQSYGDKRQEILGNVFNYRGLCFQNFGNKKMAIFDYKTSSDFGQNDSLTKLNALGVNYKPKNPPGTLRGKFIISLLLGLFSVASYFAIGLVISMTTGNDRLVTRSMPVFITLGLLIGVIILWISIYYKVYPLKKKLIALAIIITTMISCTWVLGIYQEVTDIEVGSTVILLDGRILKEPAWGSGEVKTLPKGSEVLTISGVTENKLWVQVEHEGDTGYVDTSYLRKKRK